MRGGEWLKHGIEHVAGCSPCQSKLKLIRIQLRKVQSLFSAADTTPGENSGKRCSCGFLDHFKVIRSVMTACLACYESWPHWWLVCVCVFVLPYRTCLPPARPSLAPTRKHSSTLLATGAQGTWRKVTVCHLSVHMWHIFLILPLVWTHLEV